jgi:hypothetical protein
MPLARITKTLGLTTAFNRAINSLREVRKEDVESVDQLKQTVLSHLDQAHKAVSSHTSAAALQAALEKVRDLCATLGQKEVTTEDNSLGQSEDPLKSMALPRGWGKKDPGDTDHLVVGKHAGRLGKDIGEYEDNTKRGEGWKK